eukprot:4293898-Amphidinium_carterae.1
MLPVSGQAASCRIPCKYMKVARYSRSASLALSPRVRQVRFAHQQLKKRTTHGPLVFAFRPKAGLPVSLTSRWLAPSMPPLPVGPE